jgi:hypothetical protein
MTGSAFGSNCTCKSDVPSYSNPRILFWNATCLIGAAVIRGTHHDDTDIGMVQQSLSGTMCATHARSALYVVHPHLRMSRVRGFVL